jgi:hypothetical protein
MSTNPALSDEELAHEAVCPLCHRQSFVVWVRRPDARIEPRVKCRACGEYDIAPGLMTYLETFPDAARPYRDRMENARQRNERLRLA